MLKVFLIYIVGCLFLIQISTQTVLRSAAVSNDEARYRRRLFPEIINTAAIADSERNTITTVESVKDDDDGEEISSMIQVRQLPEFENPFGEESPKQALDGTTLAAISPFMVEFFKEISSSKDLRDKFAILFDGLRKEFTPDRYPDSLITSLVTSVDGLFNSNPLGISAEALAEMGGKMVKHYYKPPDSFQNNARKFRNKSVRGAGYAIGSGSDSLSSIVRLGKDLHNSAVDYITPLTDNIPYFGTAVRFATGVGKVALDGLQVGTKYGGNYLADKIANWAETDEEDRKDEKAIRKVVERELKNRKQQQQGRPRR